MSTFDSGTSECLDCQREGAACELHRREEQEQLLLAQLRKDTLPSAEIKSLTEAEAAFARLVSVLKNHDENWDVRRQAIQRAEDCLTDETVDMEGFLDLFAPLAMNIVGQTTDPRREVSAQALGSLTKMWNTIDKRFRRLIKEGELEEYQKDWDSFLTLTGSVLKALLPGLSDANVNGPIYVAFMALVQAVALLQCLAPPETREPAQTAGMPAWVLRDGSGHKNAHIRTNCYNAVALLIREGLMPAKALDEEMREDEDYGRLSYRTSALTSVLEETLRTGLNDKDAKARSACWSCLLVLEVAEPATAEALQATLTPAHRRSLNKERARATSQIDSILSPARLQRRATRTITELAPWSPATSRGRSQSQGQLTSQEWIQTRDPRPIPEHIVHGQLVLDLDWQQRQAQMLPTRTNVYETPEPKLARTRRRGGRVKHVVPTIVTLPHEPGRLVDIRGPLPTPTSRQEIVVPVKSHLQKANMEVLNALLELPAAEITPPMTEFLVRDGVCGALFGLVGRPSAELAAGMNAGNDDLASAATVAGEAKQPASGEALVLPAQPMRQRPTTPEEEEATKQSFKVVSLICARPPSSALLTVLGQRIRSMVLHLLASFHPASAGNLYHATMILQKLLELLPGATIAVVGSPKGLPLFRHVFTSLSEPPVVGLLISVLTTSIPKALHDRLMSWLRERRFTAALAACLTSPKSTIATVQAAREFALNMLGEQVRDTASGRLSMESLLADVAEGPKSLVPALLAFLTAEPQPDESYTQTLKKQHSAEVLAALLDRTRLEQLVVLDYTQMGNHEFNNPLENLPQKSIKNPFFPFKPQIAHALRTHFQALARAVVAGEVAGAPEEPTQGKHKISNLPPPCRLTLLRLRQLELLLSAVEYDKSLLLELPREVWYRLTEWAFQFRDNNFYCKMLLQLLCLLLHHPAPEAEQLLEDVLVTHKFWSKLVHTAEHQQACVLSAYTTLLGNHIRLTAQVLGRRMELAKEATAPPEANAPPHTPFLLRFVESDADWHAFVPTLVAKSMAQLPPNALAPGDSRDPRYSITPPPQTASAMQSASPTLAATAAPAPASPTAAAGSATPPLTLSDTSGNSPLASERLPSPKKDDMPPLTLSDTSPAPPAAQEKGHSPTQSDNVTTQAEHLAPPAAIPQAARASLDLGSWFAVSLGYADDELPKALQRDRSNEEQEEQEGKPTMQIHITNGDGRMGNSSGSSSGSKSLMCIEKDCFHVCLEFLWRVITVPNPVIWRDHDRQIRADSRPQNDM
eukprot:g43881.t1